MEKMEYRVGDFGFGIALWYVSKETKKEPVSAIIAYKRPGLPVQIMGNYSAERDFDAVDAFRKMGINKED